MENTLKNLVECRLKDKTFIESLVKEPVENFSNYSGDENNDDGIMGEIKSIVVKTKSGSTHHLVYKGVSHENDQLFSLNIHLGYFLKENLFYKTIAPEMEKLCKSSLPIAKMYDCLTDGKTDFLVLEDLRPLGYHMPEKYPGLTFDETSLVLQNLGAFHAKGYHFVQKRGHDFFTGECSAFLKHFSEAMDVPSNPHWKHFSKLCLDITDFIKDGISVDQANKMDAICSRVTPIIIVPWKLAQEGKYFSVICHGDLWANNIMFKYSQDGRNKPLDVKFIDFPHCNKGSIYQDLYYFIFTSTSPEFRKEHMNTILDIYYEAFNQELQRIGTQCPPAFTREKFNEEFFENIISALAHATFAVSFQLGVFSKPDASKEIENETINETLKIVPLLRAFEDFNTFCPIAFKNSERAIKRLKDLIHEFSEMNVL